jgi:glycosyltransferase involved in cell wall biosynthesis
LPRFDRVFRPRAFAVALKGATRIIAISEVVRKQLIDWCGVSREKVITVRHGAAGAEDKQVVEFKKLDGPFLYYPAATHRHKGHEVLLRTFAKLIRQEEFRNWKLVLSGQRTAEWGRLQRVIEVLGLKNSVVHLGFMPFEEVLGVYQKAEAVVFPSEYEGLGLPVLEAGKVGRKIITSNLEVFAELGVPAERRIDFSNVEALKGALKWEGAVLQGVVKSWEECAAETLDVLMGSGNSSLPQKRGGAPAA